MKSFMFLLTTAFILIGCPGQRAQRSMDTFYLQLSAEPKTLDAFKGRIDGYSRAIFKQVFDSLLDTDPDTYENKPSLAKKFSVSKDGKVFSFQIHTNAVFTDGHPLTTEDIQFSFNAIFNDKYELFSLRPYYENIEKIEIVDDYNIKFYAKEKYFQTLGYLGSLLIVPKHIYENSKTEHHRVVVGSGPWEIDEYKQGRSLSLKRNAKWWGNDLEQYKNKYRMRKKQYRFIKDEKIILESFKKGDLDYIGLSTEQYHTQTQSKPWGETVFTEVVENKSPKALPFIAWNLKKELFKNKDIRKALTHLYDRETLVKKFLHDNAVPGAGPWHPDSPAATNRKALRYDPKLAKELLRKNGWSDSDKNGVLDKNGKEFRFTLLNPNANYEKYFTLYKEALKKVGIDMSISNLEWNAFQRKMDDHDFDALFLVWGPGSIHVDPKQIWHSSGNKKGGSNFINYSNKDVDRLIDEGRLILDDDKRNKVFKKVYDLIAEDAPYIFLWYSKKSFYGYSHLVERPKPFFNYDVGTDYWKLKKEVH